MGLRGRLLTLLVIAVVSIGLVRLLHTGSAAHPDLTDRAGLVFRYYPGSGYRFQPLLSFTHLALLVRARRAPAAARLVNALIARSERQDGDLYWSYDFPFEGGTAPWRSGFVQLVAVQDLAAAGRLLQRPALLADAEAALRGLRHGLLLHVGGGLWIREYGFKHMVILNSQLQSLVSLKPPTLRELPDAKRLVDSLYRATVRMLPRFDLGCHSLYALGGPVADRHYQDYHLFLLKILAGKHREQPLFRRLYLRWRKCA